jgi:hypothetical protein
MRQLLFIDTNIYLRFYDSNHSEYKKLLKTIRGLNERIFITRQIQFEIERNKLDVFRNSFDAYIKQAKSYNNITLPEHLDNIKDPEIGQWNKERRIIISNLEKSNKKLSDIYRKKMLAISKSEDEVSNTLKELFKNSHEHTEDQLLNAQQRKERGNPPGKATDPLGDQINWEQLLNYVSETDELYIISNDYDLLITIENNSFLNPFLLEELLSINPKMKIHSFHSLSQALLTINKGKAIKLENLPSEAILEEINIIEEKDFKNKINTSYNKDLEPRQDELQRLTYLFRHALIGEAKFINELEKLKYTPEEIRTIVNAKV